ncbi:serine/threonine protein kinase [Chondromyces crocatus]|uniref:Protein kinase domain-containing protein n=1 Tax=Chondromyces crocatus TaxID=52 RepID=A0A0K1E5H5_CHOCO|nr:serine/threonine-protein kinase [Chondromyces crocatus]AKT36120.1 uncharacterized protein CMC5_002330 [Chondromyces crocatus]
MAETKPTDQSDKAALRRADSLLGRVISQRYRIDEVIAMGGMGAVYRGEHVRMRKRVAIKILHPDTEGLPELVKRFEREAVAGAHIQHPNVATATDFGETEDGLFYLVAEYVRGTTLHDIIRRGPLAPSRAASIARQLAAALGAAHTMDIVHRDLKPRNVMVVEAQNDLVKLIDWGFAKVRMERLSAVAAELEHADRPSMTERLTGAGVVFGTMAYLAPEAALGMESVDARSDLFALGIIFYEMLAGKHPFSANDPVQLFTKMATLEAPPIAERAPSVSVPPELEAIARRLIKKLPEARFASAEELLAALDEACEAAALPMPRPVSASTRPPSSNMAKANVPPPAALPKLDGGEGAAASPVPTSSSALLELDSAALQSARDSNLEFSNTVPSSRPFGPSERTTLDRASDVSTSEASVPGLGSPSAGTSSMGISSEDTSERVSSEQGSLERVSSEQGSLERVSSEQGSSKEATSERASTKPLSREGAASSASPQAEEARASSSDEGSRASSPVEGDAKGPSTDRPEDASAAASSLTTSAPASSPSEPPPPPESVGSRPALPPEPIAPAAAAARAAGNTKMPAKAVAAEQSNLGLLVFVGAVIGIFCVWLVTRGTAPPPPDPNAPVTRPKAPTVNLRPPKETFRDLKNLPGPLSPSASPQKEAPGAEEAPDTVPSAAASAASADTAPDPAAREALQNAVKKRSWDEAVSTLLDLAKRDRKALEDPGVAEAARNLAVLVASPPGTNPHAEPVFTALATQFGTGGGDVLYRLVETRGRSGPALRAAEILRKPELSAHASPPVRAAFALRDAPCNEKLGLLDQAVKDGDERTLLVLETVVRACFKHSPPVTDAIQKLKDRLKSP